MFCLASRLRRGGQELNRFDATRAPVLGQLLVYESPDPATRRTLRIARMLPCGGRDFDLLPPLFDAVVLYASGRTWTIRGTEREQTSNGVAAYEQSWVLRELRGPQIGEIERRVAAGQEPLHVSVEE